MGARGVIITKGEQIVANMLMRAGLSFRYEPKEFRLHFGGSRVAGFRPDFYLPEEQVYIEVGNAHNKRNKLRRMRCSFPNVQVVVLDNKIVEKELPDMDPKFFWQYLTETWIEQEYFEQESIERRIQARLEQKESSMQKAPSHRTH